MCPPRPRCFSALIPSETLTSAAALQSLLSIQLPTERARSENIKINPPNLVSKIITRYVVTVASGVGEASFRREPQRESIAGALPCRSQVVLELTGQQGGVFSCVFMS